MAARMPRKLGRYEVLEEIGRGANAVVYKARDTILERIVALKVVRPQLLWEPEAVERFLREARAAAQLEHPNIATVYDVGEVEGVHFIAMQYIPGRTVKEMAEEEPFSPETALEILQQVAAALDYAHQRDFIHRDVKPSNIVVTEEGRAYLTDFGLVKGLAWASLSTSGGVMGTPHYISPEMAEGEEVDWRTDLYSLGVVLYEMLTGKVPFDAPTPMAVLRAHADKQPPSPRELSPGLSEALETVLLKALAKKREERYQSGVEMVQALSEAREQKAQEAEERARQEKLASLYDAVQAALKARSWETTLKHCGDLERLEPDYRDVAQIKAQAQAKLREQREAEERARRDREEVRGREEGQPGFGRIPLSTWAFVIVLVVGLAAIGAWALDALRVKPTPVVVEKVVTATPLLPTHTVLPAPTLIPPTHTPMPPTATLIPPPDLPGMVYVPAGEFIMGSPEGEGDDNEHPQRTVYLDAFYIGKYEVTNRQFSQFVGATGYTTDAETAGWGWALTGKVWEEVEGADWRHPQGPGSSIEGKMDHPVVQVSWNDADAYCQWAGKRLPTEAEWEKAARGTDGREYTWGNNAPDGSKLNYCDVNCEFDRKDSSVDDGYADTAPVGHYEAGKSPYGAYDMVGNVWEWVADWYDADYYSTVPESNPQGPDSGEIRVLRGGSWDNDRYWSRCATRNRYLPDHRYFLVGFRCCADATSSP